MSIEASNTDGIRCINASIVFSSATSTMTSSRNSNMTPNLYLPTAYGATRVTYVYPN